ncbi:uncharacterized protein LOC109540896 isoform X1 [Dendroctonus ponderosae]|uniref:Uncharacterized protein n=2 Tax=Dendroctonus ponderosae TaxID=77166 RepID=A0AAR5PVE8_DENPD|nr:uncharacterized protein LOC109540896 isoform X1 [Dendroctonus ponderosae]
MILHESDFLIDMDGETTLTNNLCQWHLEKIQHTGNNGDFGQDCLANLGDGYSSPDDLRNFVSIFPEHPQSSSLHSSQNTEEQMYYIKSETRGSWTTLPRRNRALQKPIKCN